MPDKVCTKCGTPKSIAAFNADNRGRRSRPRSQCKACEALYLQRLVGALKNQIFAKHGEHCVRCLFADRRALQIDHVKGGGNQEHRAIRNTARFLKKVLADTTGAYQILCANCNWIKRAERREVPLAEVR